MNIISNSLKRLFIMISAFFITIVSVAQEGGADIDVDINKDSGGAWYGQPWVWIVGGAVFILLLVALLRGNKARD
jgi:hypothetical protein